MRTACYSVKLRSMVSISEKCYAATAFDGSEELIPKSQVYGRDYDNSTEEVDAYWITAWILEQKKLQYSKKRHAFFDSKTKARLADGPIVSYSTYVPAKIEAKQIQVDESLTR